MLVATPGAGAAYLTGLDRAAREIPGTRRKITSGPQIGFAWSPTQFNRQARGPRRLRSELQPGRDRDFGQYRQNPGLVVIPNISIATPSSPNPGIVLRHFAESATTLLAIRRTPTRSVTFGRERTAHQRLGRCRHLP